jgi:hypothetical protein
MTICIAALCGNGHIFGASDRMITSGDIEYEPSLTQPPQRFGNTLKVFRLTNSIAIMTAGDASVQSVIIQNVINTVVARVTQDPSNWWDLGDVADLYVRHHDNLRRRRAESAILTPLGLSNETFIDRQSGMSNEFIQTITRQLTTFDMPIVEAIITGVDRKGSHIYVVNNYNRNRSCVVSCADTIGFAAIGIGAHHAESLFMLAGHHRESPIPDTLFLTYLAKKRAEVAPGVGKETDMLMVGRELGSLQNVMTPIVQQMDAIYQYYRTQEQSALSTARLKATEWVDSLSKSQQAQQPQESSATEVKIEPPKPSQ